MKADNEVAAPSPQFACALLLAAIFFLWFATEIPKSALSGKHDPGPRALPILLSCLLLAGAAVELAQACIRRFSGRQTSPTSENRSGRNGQLLILIGGLVFYLAAIPQLGFYATTIVFAFLGSWWLGARWWSALLASLAMVAVVFLIFGMGFEVQL